MKVFFAIDEAFPLFKIGGLGDVGGSLPQALVQMGIDIRLGLPKHPEIKIASATTVDQFSISYNQQALSVSVLLTNLPPTSIPVYLFQEDTYLSSHTDASDNHADKFTVFSLAIATWLTRNQIDFSPEIIHLHDWHTALLPVILEHKFHQPRKTIITIHNLAFQGNTETPVLNKLGISEDDCEILKSDSQDLHLNILLEGILHSDVITTVSPTYSREILTPEYGEKIYEKLASKKDKLFGILNGIDVNLFNPQTDLQIFHTFSASTAMSGKALNKAKLQLELHLPSDPNALMIGFVGRVDPQQKGVQLIIESIQNGQLPPPGHQFVFLGTGDSGLESSLHQASDSVKNCIVVTRYDEQLAARIYAASDLVIIPSKFEPCGLVQMIAMRYGALPVARKTGGLADTIIHNTDGFLFEQYTSTAMIEALHQAIDTLKDPQKHSSMVQTAMAKDFSWDQSALKYHELYSQLLTP